MKRILTLLLAGVAAAGLAHADDFSTLTRDVDSGSPGYETIMPNIVIAADANGDGVPDGVNFSFKVYQGGTNTLLRQTTVKTFNFPPVPCAPANNVWHDAWVEKYLTSSPASPREYAGWVGLVGCTDGSGNNLEARSTYVYSANLATGTGAWVFGVNRDFQDLHGIYAAGSTTSFSEIIFVTTGNAPGTLPGKLTVYRRNPFTGAAIGSNTYSYGFINP